MDKKIVYKRRQHMKIKAGDIYTTYHKKLDCYIACQITKVSEKILLN